MCQMRDLASVITKLEALVQGRNTSVSHANEIEGDLTELFSDREDGVIEDFIHDLAFYRPEGGEGLFDFERFKPVAEAALRRLRNINNDDT
jgi:hypothetical protein